jgi:mRNA-degrading endonuclease RelE of RelBE toxin-antitoxin system
LQKKHKSFSKHFAKKTQVFFQTLGQNKTFDRQRLGDKKHKGKKKDIYQTNPHHLSSSFAKARSLFVYFI